MCNAGHVATQIRDTAETLGAESLGLAFGGSAGAKAATKQTSQSAQASPLGELATGANKDAVYEKGIAALALGNAAFGGGVAAAPAAPASGTAAVTPGVNAAVDTGESVTGFPGTATTSGAVASSATPIADTIKIAASIAGIAGGAASIYALANAPKPPKPEATPPLPQAGRAPDYQAVSDRTQKMFGDGGPFGGGTFLTGPGGVAPGSVNVGKNILLGT